MRVKTILISFIVLSILLAGCGTYQYPSGKEIPVSVAEGEDVDDFKSEFEKLQALLDEEEAEVVEEEAIEIVEEIKEEAEEEIVKTVEVEEEKTEEVVEEIEFEEDEVVEVEEGETSQGIPTIKVSEGELVNLAIESEDDDDDTITYKFTEPLDKDGKWQTDYDDAGKYKVTITASDGELSTSQEIYIVVEDFNRVPVISNFYDIVVDEGDIIDLKPKVTDPEGGSLVLEYSGWMTTGTKEVGYDDAGSYEVTLKATSSESGEFAKETITITVKDKNRAPKIISITNK